MNPRKAWWQLHDWWLTGSVIALMTISLIMLSSSAISQQDNLLTNQLLFILLGAIVYIAGSWVQPSWYWKASPLAYSATLILLIGLAIFGQATRGAVSWLDLGAFSLQPSEFMKVFMVCTLAYAYTLHHHKHWSSWSLFPLYAVIGALPIGLILLQPDFGTATIMLVGWLAVVWMSPISKKTLTAVFCGLGLAAIIGWSILAPYQQQRVFTFLNPTADPLGSGYNVLQSVIAVQSGGLIGQGWGQGTQSHLNFLPEHQTDFIFASLSEEFGLVGGLFVVSLYAIIFYRGLRLIWFTKDQPTIILLSGLTFMILVQAIINIAMNIGLAPVTGIPLPFVSYGGSSLLTSALALAIIQSIAMHPINKE